MKTAGAGVVGLAVGAGLGYSVSSMEGKGPAATVTVTTGGPAGAGIFSIPVEGDTVAERCMNAMKFVVKRDNLAGQELVVMHPGGDVGNYDANVPEFESGTGMKFKHSEVPLNEMFDKAMLEAVSKTGAYDVFSLQPAWIADIVESGLVIETTPYERYFDNRVSGEPDGFIYPMDRFMAEYKGKRWAIVHDTDLFFTYMNLNFLDDENEKEAFEKQFGYKLAAPDTWQQYIDIASHFYRPDQNLYGAVELRSVDRGYINWFAYYSSKKYPCAFPFDDDMRPLITGTEGVKATEEFLESLKYMPKETPSWDFQPGYAVFYRGEAALTFNFPSLANQVINPEISKVVGKFTTSVVPGSIVKGPDGTDILLRRTVQGAGWVHFVNNYSKKKDLAMLYAMWHNSPEKGPIAVAVKGSWKDPSRYNECGPNADPRIIETRAPRYSRVAETTLDSARFAVPVIAGIRGAFEYNLTLSKNLNSAMLGLMDAETALRKTAEEWEKTTDRIGRDKQVEAWRALKKWYPTAIT